MNILTLTDWKGREVKAYYPPDMSKDEAYRYSIDEIQHWEECYPTKQIAYIELALLGIKEDEVEIKAVEKSQIKRVRRITGYLSEIDNFNESKRAELGDRYPNSDNILDDLVAKANNMDMILEHLPGNK